MSAEVTYELVAIGLDFMGVASAPATLRVVKSGTPVVTMVFSPPALTVRSKV